MYYLADVNNYGAVVIKDTENKDYCEVYSENTDALLALGAVLGLDTDRRRITTKCDLAILKQLDLENFAWVQKVIPSGKVSNKDYCKMDSALNFKSAEFDDFGRVLFTLPSLITLYEQVVDSYFIYTMEDKLYVLADFEKTPDAKSCVCTYRAYPIKDAGKLKVAITKGLIFCK